MRWLFPLVFLMACGPNSLEDFHQQGEVFSKAFAEELNQIQSREELIESVPLIRRRFDELVDLMIAAERYAKAHAQEAYLDPTENPYADELLDELERLYRLEGGRDLIEGAQKEALIRLDAARLSSR